MILSAVQHAILELLWYIDAHRGAAGRMRPRALDQRHARTCPSSAAARAQRTTRRSLERRGRARQAGGLGGGRPSLRPMA
jgi:hypothetical protein